MKNKLDKYQVGLLIISFGFVLWGGLFIFRSSFMTITGVRYFSLFDDAMISMRYAWNLSHGLGLVWNPGVHIEGYTNLLMTLFMSLITLLFDKRIAVLMVQISGIIFLLANAYVVRAIAEQVSPSDHGSSRKVFVLLSFLLALGYYPLLYWTLMGMETGMITFLLSLSVLLAIQSIEAHFFLRTSMLSIITGLLYLVRPDTLVIAIPILVFYIYKMTKGYDWKRKIKLSLFIFGILMIFIIGVEIFRINYYHQYLPNTYILKLTGVPLGIRIKNGVIFVKPFLVSILPIILVVLLGLIFHYSKEKLLISSIAAVIIAYQIYVGGDAWNYWRMLAPFIPLLLSIFLLELMLFAYKVLKLLVPGTFIRNNYPIPGGYFPAIVVTIPLLFSLYLMNVRFLREFLLIDKPYYASTHKVNVNTALILNEITSKNAVVGVFWGGIIPYYTSRKADDFLGKSDSYIANLPPDLSGAISYVGMSSRPGHNKFDLDYSIRLLRPTYVQRFYWGPQDLTEWAKTEYVQVIYQGTKLYLLKDSPDVYWDKLTNIEMISK